MPKVKKQKTVLAKSPPVKPARSAHQPQKQVSSHIKRLPLQTWTCSSIIDQQSAEAVARLLAAAETRTSGATIKSLTLAPHIVHKKPTFAVTCETLKHLPLLQQLLHKIDLLAQHENQLTPAAAYVLTYELLFGQGFRAKGPAERAVLQQAEELKLALQSLLQQADASDAAAWLEQHSNHHQQQQQQQGGVVRHPRYSRVNTLKATVADVLAELQQQYGLSTSEYITAVADASAAAAADCSSNGTQTIPITSSSSSSGGMRRSLTHPAAAAAAAAVKHQTNAQQQQQQGVRVDDLLPDVLVFPPGTDLHDHPLVQQGVLILQSKASCMPAHALNPQPGWQVVDCCAAPGNKTTHVAALLHAADRSSHGAASADGVGGSSLQKKLKTGKKRDKGDTTQALAADAKVYAFDKDPKRLKRLQANVNTTGAREIVTVTQADFLTIDPEAVLYSKVQGVILDPSCSGSGTVISRMDHLLPRPMAPTSLQHNKTTNAREDPDMQRVEQLAKFQEAAVLHALKFPALKRLVYSTCSIHQRENEDVVSRVLPVAEQLGFRVVDPFPRWHRRGLPVTEGSEKLVRVDPYMDGTDGFFVAVFERC